MSAEEKFFCTLSNVLGSQYVDTSKQKPTIVYANHENNRYIDARVLVLLHKLRTILCSTNDFSNRITPIDGIIRNHSVLGTRIVEFDEYQHFTQQRKLAIKIAKQYCPLPFHDHYLRLLEDANVTTEASHVTKRNGFHKPVAGFRYEGGRMSQRAYFDTLKDYAHLSEEGQGLQAILRFSIPDFGVKTERDFLRLDESTIRAHIKRMLAVIT